MDRKKLTLVILLAVLCGAVIYAFWRQPPRRTVEKLKYTSGMRAGAARASAAKATDDSKLHLELLDRETARFSGFRRNIFRPIFSGDMKQPLMPKVPVKLPVPPPPLPPPPPPPPPTPAQMAMQEASRFTFLGFLQKENRKIIFLSRDKEIFLVKKGDKLAGKYDVASISDESLTIRLSGSGEEVAVPLIENRPLAR